MVYFCNMYCKAGTVCVYIHDSQENILYTKKDKIEYSGENKYNGFLHALKLLGNRLQYMNDRHMFKETDVVRILIPSTVVYGWFNGDISEKYQAGFYSFKDVLINIKPKVEVIQSILDDALNRARSLRKAEVSDDCTTEKLTTAISFAYDE